LLSILSTHAQNVAVGNAVPSYCCLGATSSDPTITSQITINQQCNINSNSGCVSTSTSGGGTTTTIYTCAPASGCGNVSGCCKANNCNCPGNIHKNTGQVAQVIGDMRNIMYPVLGMVFGISWIIMGFCGNVLPHAIIIIVIALVDCVFGIFLIFIPTTAYLGLLFIALGALSIAVVRHGIDDAKGMMIIFLGSILAFLYTGGLIFIIGGQGSFVDQIAGGVFNCEASMDIVHIGNDYYNLNTRCENWALFVAFCVFVLFLVQPITIICAYFVGKDGGGSGQGNGQGKPKKSDEGRSKEDKPSSEAPQQQDGLEMQ